MTETILKLMDAECKLLLYMILFASKERVRFGWILEVFKNTDITEGTKREDHLNQHFG